MLWIGDQQKLVLLKAGLKEPDNHSPNNEQKAAYNLSKITCH
jgi:hypothetical protein